MKRFTIREHVSLAREYRSNFRNMEVFLTLSHDEIAARQLTQIQSIIRHAYERSDFYRKLYMSHGIDPADIRTWEDYQQLPTVTKDEIIAGRDLIPVTNRLKAGVLRTSHTSGSSGRNLEILADSERWIISALMTLRMYRSSFRFNSGDKAALIYTSPFPYLRAFRPYGVHYINTLTPPKQIIERLLHRRPRFLISYPSVLIELITLYPNECRAMGLRAVSTNSEQSSQQQRDAIAEAFGCPVFDEYSTEELILGGFQCAHKLYHLQEDCAYIEALDIDSDVPVTPGQVGEIVGTNLINKVFPFIRYRQGDLGAVTVQHCPCGNNGRVLSAISGRKNSSFKLSDGRILPSGRILDWTYMLVLRHKLPIEQFQIVQQTPDGIEVFVVGNTTYRQEDCAPVIADSFRKEFGMFLQVEVTPVASIPRTPAGKHIPIRSSVA